LIRRTRWGWRWRWRRICRGASTKMKGKVVRVQLEMEIEEVYSD
jgi:hypothetical protein